MAKTLLKKLWPKWTGDAKPDTVTLKSKQSTVEMPWDDLEQLFNQELAKELEALKVIPFKAARGYDSEEELGFQKGLTANDKLRNRAIDQRLANLTGENHE